jgi:hypothetical protein
LLIPGASRVLVDQQSKNSWRVRLAGPCRMLGQKRLDEINEIATAIDRWGPVNGDDGKRQCLHPTRPAIQAPRGAFVSVVHGWE